MSEILEDSSVDPTFNDPLDLDLARNAAPLAAFGNLTSNDFFSARIGCQTYGVYGMDLAALCPRSPRH